MIVVSDTTPLISFMKIGQLDLMEKLFGEVQIPQAVFSDMMTSLLQRESRAFSPRLSAHLHVHIITASCVRNPSSMSGRGAGVLLYFRSTVCWGPDWLISA